MENYMSSYSLNNRIALEVYVKEGLEAKKMAGIATPGQRDRVKGLKVVLDTHLNDGKFIAKGSVAYIREEVLHAHPWASKPLNCDLISGPFILADISHIEFIKIDN